jgi:LysM repeat protein
MAHVRKISIISLILFVIPHLAQASKTHVARKSESLHSIARKNHVSVDELKSVNNLTGTRIARGTRLIIPSHAARASRKARVAERTRTYRVAKGDTLPRISKKTGIRLSELRRLNGLKGNRIKRGQVLALNEAVPAVEEQSRTSVSTANRLQLINHDLLNEKEFNDTMAELSDIDADRPVDLAKKS